jgi:hypothetical protein
VALLLEHHQLPWRARLQSMNAFDPSAVYESKRSKQLAICVRTSVERVRRPRRRTIRVSSRLEQDDERALASHARYLCRRVRDPRRGNVLEDGPRHDQVKMVRWERQFCDGRGLKRDVRVVAASHRKRIAVHVNGDVRLRELGDNRGQAAETASDLK